MSTPYDVFESMHDGNIWIGTAKTIAEAIQLIGKHSSGGTSYLVYCQETHQPSYFKKENNKVVEAQAI
jgi:hypothetical protein